MMTDGGVLTDLVLLNCVGVVHQKDFERIFHVEVLETVT